MAWRGIHVNNSKPLHPNRRYLDSFTWHGVCRGVSDRAMHQDRSTTIAVPPKGLTESWGPRIPWQEYFFLQCRMKPFHSQLLMLTSWRQITLESKDFSLRVLQAPGLPPQFRLTHETCGPGFLASPTRYPWVPRAMRWWLRFFFILQPRCRGTPWWR